MGNTMKRMIKSYMSLITDAENKAPLIEKNKFLNLEFDTKIQHSQLKKNILHKTSHLHNIYASNIKDQYKNVC